MKKPMMPKPKAAVVKAVPKPTHFNQAGKPDPNGLFDKEGFQVRFAKDVKKDSFTKQSKPPADTDAAKRAGFKR